MTLPAQWEAWLNAFMTHVYAPQLSPRDQRRRRKVVNDFLYALANRYPGQVLDGVLISQEITAGLDQELLSAFAHFVATSPAPLPQRAFLDRAYTPAEPRARKKEPATIAPHLQPGDPWRACIDDFLTEKCARSKKTFQAYHHVLSEFFAGGKHPATITKRDVLAYIHGPVRQKRNRGAAPGASTRNNRLTPLSSLYQYAASYTILGPDGRPTILFKDPSPTLGIEQARVERKPKGLTQEELRTFFKAMPTDSVKGLRDRSLFLTYLYTASRRESIIGLRFGDIEACTFVENGTRRNGWKYRTIRKGSGGAYIYAELPEPARLAIWKYLQVSGRLRTIRPEDPIFVSHGPSALLHPNKAITSGSVANVMKTYLRKAGLPLTHSLHSLRHSSAQLRFLSGQNLLSLSKTLGHKNLTTTQIYLSALLCGEQDDGAAALARELGEL